MKSFLNIMPRSSTSGASSTKERRRHVLGLFQTVWHDDGETLYEATWYPVIYAAAAAWQDGDSRPKPSRDDFPFAFFGSMTRAIVPTSAGLATALRRLEPAALLPTARPTRSSGLIPSRPARGARVAGKPIFASRAAAEIGRTGSLFQTTSAARQRSVRDVSCGAQVRRPRAKIPNRLGSARDV